MRENILIVRLKSIGDIVFTLPAVNAVRENFPEAKLHFLISAEHAPLVRGFAAVDEIIPLDRAVLRSGNLPKAASSLFHLLRELRSKNFSLAIDLHGYGETELLSWWSGAPRRWGSVYQRGRGWAYTRAIPRSGRVHPADAHLAMLADCGLKTDSIRNEYLLPDDALAGAKDFFHLHKLDLKKPTLFIQPFTSAAHKNWPLENYLRVAWHFHSQGMQIIFGGGSKEREQLKPAHDAGFVVAAGTPLLVSAGLMKFSTLVVGADTGLLHLAVAMGRRVTMLMKSNATGSPHPFQHVDWALTPDFGKIVADIPVKTVVQRLTEALAAQRTSV